MLSAFKPVGDGSHEPTTTSDSNSPSSNSNPQSTSSYSTPTMYYPMVTSTASQSWEPTVLIKPHPPDATASTATPTKRRATSDKAKKKKRKKQEIDHSGFVPRKIASSSSSTVKNPLLVTPLPLEKKEENESIKETDDLFSLYDDFDVAPAVAPPTDHPSCSSSIWDNFEASTVQPKQQSYTSDSEGSSDVSSEGEEECVDVTPTVDYAMQPVNEIDTAIESVDKVEKNESGSLQQQQPDDTRPLVEDRKETKNERLLRLLGMPMKSFLSAGHQCPLKDHTTMKVTNSGSYLDKPNPSKYCTPDNSQTVTMDQVVTTVTVVKNDNSSKSNQHNDVKKPDGLSFGLSKKRETLRQSTAGQLFDKEDCS